LSCYYVLCPTSTHLLFVVYNIVKHADYAPASAPHNSSYLQMYHGIMHECIHICMILNIAMLPSSQPGWRTKICCTPR